MPWLLELFRIASHRRNQVRVYVPPPPRSRMQNLLEEPADDNSGVYYTPLALLCRVRESANYHLESGHLYDESLLQ
jgi:hypothetical protein